MCCLRSGKILRWVEVGCLGDWTILINISQGSIIFLRPPYPLVLRGVWSVNPLEHLWHPAMQLFHYLVGIAAGALEHPDHLPAFPVLLDEQPDVAY